MIQKRDESNVMRIVHLVKDAGLVEEHVVDAK